MHSEVLSGTNAVIRDVQCNWHVTAGLSVFCQRISRYHLLTWKFSVAFLSVVSFRHHLDDFYWEKISVEDLFIISGKMINRNLNRKNHFIFNRGKAARDALTF